MKPTILILSLCMLTSNAYAQFADPPWRYTFEKPADGWEQVNYDDTSWPTGLGGFGEYFTPGSRVRTPWLTNNIWIRRSVELGAIPKNPAFYLYHEDDAVVFLNGQKVAEFKGYTNEYKVVPLDETAVAAVKQGTNLLAVHCIQGDGGQAIAYVSQGAKDHGISPGKFRKENGRKAFDQIV